MKVTKDARVGIILFLIPAAVLFSIFFIYPVGYVAVMSFFSTDAITAPSFQGIANYVEIFEDRQFGISVKNNLIWAAASCLIQVPLALLVAIILSAKPHGWKFFRTVYFFPQVISSIALAALWSAVYNSQFGIINSFLRLLGRDDLTRNWLGDPKTALFCVIVYNLFYIGYYMVIIMAGIAGIDQTYYEAARIDGATRFQEEVYITIPLAKPVIVTCVTLAAVFALRAFDQVFMLTGGGPANRTSVMVLYLYQEMNKNHYGTADAAAVILILMGVVVISVIRRISRASEGASE